MTTYTKDDLSKMSLEEINKILEQQNVRFLGTGIVRDKHGNPKYDQPSLKGTYGESDG